ncbi:hypothetical protein Tco_1062192 [Tanacetum coccineum]
MDDPNIIMKEYIRLEEEKALKRGKVFNWETAKYGRIWYDEDVHDLRSVENEFSAIVFNDNLTSNETLSCEPTVSSLNDEIDFRILFDDSDDEDYTVIFENEFLAIVYNDALTSKSDLSIEPTLYPQHIDEFDLKDEISLSEYDKKEQNVLYFNDLFPFNIVYPDNLKLDKGNDDNKINMIQSSGGLNVNIVTWNHFVNGILFNLIKNLYVPFGIPFDPKRYYKDGDCAKMLWRTRAIRRFGREDEDGIHWGRWAGGSGTRWDLMWLALYVFSWEVLDVVTFERRSLAPEKVTSTDLIYLRSMDRGATNVLYLLAQYLFRHVEGRKSGSRLFGGHFIGRLAHHFGLIGDDWAWVAPGLERQQVAVAGAPGAVEDSPAVDEGVQADPAPILGRLEEEVMGLRQDFKTLRGLVKRSMTDQGRFSTWMITCMPHIMEASGQTYQEFDGTFRGSSPAAFQRCTGQRTDEPNTSAALQQPDP